MIPRIKYLVLSSLPAHFLQGVARTHISYLSVFPPGFSVWNVAWLRVCSIALHMYAVRGVGSWLVRVWFWCGGGTGGNEITLAIGKVDSWIRIHVMLVWQPGTWCTSDTGRAWQIINKWRTKGNQVSDRLYFSPSLAVVSGHIVKIYMQYTTAW